MDTPAHHQDLPPRAYTDAAIIIIIDAGTGTAQSRRRIFENGSVSELLDVLSNPAVVGTGRVVVEQAELSGQLEELTRAILRAWLLRGLNDNPRTARSG